MQTLLSTEELVSTDYVAGVIREPKRLARVPIWDDYRIKSRINNLPRTISCNSDLCLHHRFLKSLFSVPQLLSLFNLVDYLFILFAVGLTVLFVYTDFVYQPDVGTLVTLILFPLTYAMGNSFSRRTDMLSTLASVRATGINMLLTICQINHGLSAPGREFDGVHIQNRHALAQSLVLRLREHLSDCRHYALSHNECDRLYYLERIYCRLNQLNWLVSQFVQGEQDPPIERLGGQLIELVNTFEHFRTGVDYQASTSVGYFLRALIIINTIFLLPWFAGFIKESGSAKAFGYLLTASIVASLLGLYRIQKRLENPIGDDWDDINIERMLSSNLLLERFNIQNNDGTTDLNRMRLFMGRIDYDPRLVFNQVDTDNHTIQRERVETTTDEDGHQNPAQVPIHGPTIPNPTTIQPPIQPPTQPRFHNLYTQVELPPPYPNEVFGNGPNVV